MERQRIAVVGSGISGLTCAYLLSHAHEVTVFEANDYIGGHTHTCDIEGPDGVHAVDTGFIVFNYATYPHFVRLMRHLGVADQPSNMSFSVQDYDEKLEYRASTLGSFFAQRRRIFQPWMYRLIYDILRFRRESSALLRSDDMSLTLGEYLTKEKYSSHFIRHFIVPMGAAIWSSGTDDMWHFPAVFFARFFANHGFLRTRDKVTWHVLQGGSRSYIAPLTKPYASRVFCNAAVRAVQRHPAHVTLTIDGQGTHDFDAVVIAAHSTEARQMLMDCTPEEARVLDAFPYTDNSVVVHTDEALMPQTRAAWASWNVHLLPGYEERVALTYDMTRLQSLQAQLRYFVTLNYDEAIAPERTCLRLRYAHPVFTPEGVQLQPAQDTLNGARRTYFCGAYWRYGFHEDGVISALNVCRKWGVTLDTIGA